MEFNVDESKQQLFDNEASNYSIGMNVEEQHRLLPKELDNLGAFDKVFMRDVQFSFTHLLTVLHMLSNWAKFSKADMSSYYHIEQDELISQLAKNIGTKILSIEEIERIIHFIIIDQKNLYNEKFQDILINEHHKRANRLTIKPLMKVHNTILWSPAATYKAHNIWLTNIHNGYLPAQFDWKNINNFVVTIKQGLEKQLENKAFQILRESKFTDHIEQQIEFKKRFKKEGYPSDLGDYDVLAYFPEKNIWLNIECKYNKPAYAIKDADTLRKTIYGTDQDDRKSNIYKFNRRYKYLLKSFDKIRKSLNWPEASISEVTILNVYISKDIYWWFEDPPYSVNVNFVRIDQFANWLEKNLS